MAVIEWGPAAAVARDDGMKLGSCLSLLQPPRYIQITPVIWVGIPHRRSQGGCSGCTCTPQGGEKIFFQA